jgi:hypothetical protein
MAEKKETKAAAAAVVDVENIAEIITKGNLADSDNVKAAIEKNKKDKDERQIRELQCCMNEAEYTEKKAVLQLRQRRAEDRATKKRLEAVKAAEAELLDGKITPRQYQEKKKEAYKEQSEAYKNAAVEYDKLVHELRDGYPGYYSYEWDESRY